MKNISQINTFKIELIGNNVNNEDSVTSENLINTSIFDEQEREIKHFTFSAGEEIERIEYEYSDKLICKETLYIENEVIESISRIYDNDKIIEEIKEYADGSAESTTYEYNDKGQLISKTTKDEEEELQKIIVYYESDKLVKEVFIDVNDVNNTVTTYLYNEQGKLEETCLTFSNSNQTFSKLLTIFNDKDQIEAEKYYNFKDILIARKLYSYNESGKIEEIEIETQTNNTFTLFEYDENNLLSERKELDKNDEIIGYRKYLYDNDKKIIEEEIFMMATIYTTGEHYKLAYEYK